MTDISCISVFSANEPVEARTIDAISCRLHNLSSQQPESLIEP